MRDSPHDRIEWERGREEKQKLLTTIVIFQRERERGQQVVSFYIAARPSRNPARHIYIRFEMLLVCCCMVGGEQSDPGPGVN